MPFPFVPFILGAAAGGATAYIATNQTFREKMEHGVGKVADTVKSGAKAGAEAVKKGAKAGADAVKSGAKAVKEKLPGQKTQAAEDKVEQPSATEAEQPSATESQKP